MINKNHIKIKRRKSKEEKIINVLNHCYKNNKLSKEFIIPPIALFNNDDLFWRKRKKIWMGIGIKSEIGRNAYGNNTFDNYNRRKNIISESTKKMANMKNNPSIFDPVLCEIIYKWFCPNYGKICDPFAGGSVRGIVAHILNYKYFGCDLNKKQIKENRKQAKDILSKNNYPTWIIGDSEEKIKYFPKVDFIFSCPPYGDLEKYSNHKEDLSNMKYEKFLNKYEKIISKFNNILKNNRFLCFVVGDFRDKNGFYRGFVAHTIKIFEKYNFKLYNEIIFIQKMGSIYFRARNAFVPSRKLLKVHQNILIFIKGNPKMAAKKINIEKLYIKRKNIYDFLKD